MKLEEIRDALERGHSACLSCGSRLNSKRLEWVEDPFGVYVDEYRKNVFLFITCHRCGYQNPIPRLLVKLHQVLAS